MARVTETEFTKDDPIFREGPQVFIPAPRPQPTPVVVDPQPTPPVSVKQGLADAPKQTSSKKGG